MYLYIGLGIAAYVAGKYRAIWFLRQILEGLYRAQEKILAVDRLPPKVGMAIHVLRRMQK